MATKKKTASGKRSGTARTRSTKKVAAATTGAASAIATVQQTQDHLRIASTSSAGTPGAKDEREVVAIRWDGDQPLSLKGWQVRDKRADHAYTFGDITLKPHATIRVHSGGQAAQDTETDVHWVRAKDVWNQESDVVHLLDARGIVRAQYIFEVTTKSKAAGRKKKRTRGKKVAAKKGVAAKQPTARKPTVKKATVKKKPVKKKPAAMASATRVKKVSVKKRPASGIAPKKKTGGKLWIVAKDCRFVGPKNDPQQEVVTIAWNGSRSLSLEGWKVYDSGGKHTYTFGDITLKANSRLRLHTGGRDEVDTPQDVYWRQRNGVWNDEGDVVTVADASGKVRASHSYGGRGGTSSRKPRTELRVQKPAPAPEKPREKVARPKTERPKTERPKTERPKTERPKTERPKTERPQVTAAPTASSGKTQPEPKAPAKQAKLRAEPSSERKKTAPKTPLKKKKVPPAAIPKVTKAVPKGSQTTTAQPEQPQRAPAQRPQAKPAPANAPRDEQPMPSAAAKFDAPEKAVEPPRDGQRSSSQTPSTTAGANGPSEPRAQPPGSASNDWKFTHPVVMLAIAALLGVVVGAFMFARSQTEVTLSKASLDELASAQKRAVEMAMQPNAVIHTHHLLGRDELRLAISAVEKALEGDTDAATSRVLAALREELCAELAASNGATVTDSELRKRPTLAAINVAIAAVKSAKQAGCDKAGHARRLEDIDRAVAAAQQAIALLSNDHVD